MQGPPGSPGQHWKLQQIPSQQLPIPFGQVVPFGAWTPPTHLPAPSQVVPVMQSMVQAVPAFAFV